MIDKLHKLLLQISPLHETIIEKILVQEQPELDKLLDLSQKILNLERYNANYTASILHSERKAYAETSIPQLQTVQKVIVKLLGRRGDLNGVQFALLCVYNQTDIPEGSTLRLKNNFTRLNAPGSEGERERRNSGASHPRTLTTRLKDLQAIEDRVTSQKGKAMLRKDREAIEKFSSDLKSSNAL